MNHRRKQPAFWRRRKVSPALDIAKLRPKGPEGHGHFETKSDARKESLRSEQLLRRSRTGMTSRVGKLRACREKSDPCEKPYCPICARRFRRWFISELLKWCGSEDGFCVITVLLDAGQLDSFEASVITSYKRKLHQILSRCSSGPVIGGFEVVYRAADKQWVLHMNLLVRATDTIVAEQIKRKLASRDLDRPVRQDFLKDKLSQLSYLLKFTTYHRPYEQRGNQRSPAKPLNPREHYALVQWMAQFQFYEFLFLYGARRRGESIRLSRAIA